MPERVFKDSEYPCRRWPQSKRCDRRGATVHTCVRSEISRLEGEIRGVTVILGDAQRVKANAEATIARMEQRIAGLQKQLGALT